MLNSFIPVSEIQNLARAFHNNARASASMAIKVMQENNDDLRATGLAASAGTYELCATMLDAMAGEWFVVPTANPGPQEIAEVMP